MIYSPRLKQLLRLLLKQPQGEYVSLDELSKELNISRRTLFRELEGIDDQLVGYPMQLESKKSKGLRLIVDPEMISSLEEQLSEDIPYRTKEERQTLLAYELIRSEEIRKLSYYASLFQVSAATISNDLDALEPRFEAFDLRLERSGKNRIELAGKESARRVMMSDIVYHQLSGHSGGQLPLISSTALSDRLQNESARSIYSLFDQDILARVVQLIDSNFHEWELEDFAPSSLAGLVIHLVIAIERIRKHEPIQSAGVVLDQMKGDPIWGLSGRITQAVEKEFHIRMEESETAFIAIHLKGAMKASSEAELQSVDRPKQVAAILLDGFDEQILAALSGDQEFLQGLWAHLEPALIRIDNHMPIYNPLLEDLKTEYRELFGQVTRALDHVKDVTGLEFSEPEAGFITMHVGAALEKKRQKPAYRPVRCAVVCASGIGVSAMLLARLRKAFGSEITLQTRSFDDVIQHRLGDAELLISTFGLDDPGVDTIQVSALLSSDDIRAIAGKIEQLQKLQTSQSSPLPSDSLVDVLESIQEFASTARQLLQNTKFEIAPNHLTPAQAIAICARAAKGESAGIEEDLLSREALGSVIVNESGFALLHCVTSHTDTAQMVILFPESEEFTGRDYRNVRYILAEIAPSNGPSASRELFSKVSMDMIENGPLDQALKVRDESAARNAIGSLIRKELAALQERVAGL